jgi:hypothetical protein
VHNLAHPDLQTRCQHIKIYSKVCFYSKKSLRPAVHVHVHSAKKERKCLHTFSANKAKLLSCSCSQLGESPSSTVLSCCAGFPNCVLSFVVVLGFLTVLCFLTAICCSNLHCIFYFNYSLIPNCNVFPKGTEWPDLIGPRVVPVKGLCGRCLSV